MTKEFLQNSQPYVTSIYNRATATVAIIGNQSKLQAAMHTSWLLIGS